MRQLVILAAALAVGGLFAATAARADLLYYPGGPVKQGNMCQISTDPELNYGYWAPCPGEPVKVAKRTKQMKS